LKGSSVLVRNDGGGRPLDGALRGAYPFEKETEIATNLEFEVPKVRGKDNCDHVLDSNDGPLNVATFTSETVWLADGRYI